MIIDITELKTGEELVIKMLLPPLSQYSSKVGCWGDIREELLGGQMIKWLFTPYFVGEIDDEFAGSMSYFTSVDTRDVGLVEFVDTVEKHRRKGVASALLTKLIERFKINGGLVLYLCTSNPIAGMLYEKHGFWYNVGDGMRYLTFGAEDFDKNYLGFYGTARIRNATWNDLPRASVLYNHSEPQWFIKDYLTHSFGETRFESHFVKLMKRVENQKGVLLVLENHKQRVVGVAALERFDTFYEQHVATLSFRVCPSYFGQVSELLIVAAQKARELSITTLQIYIADCDDEQIQLVKEAGFSYEAQLRNRLRNQDRLMDLLVYTLSLPGTARPLRSKGDYYGGRKQWQEERIAYSR